MNAQTRRTTAPSRRAQAPQGWRRFFTWKRILIGLGVFVLLVIGGFVTAYAAIGVPNPNQLATSQASIIYYADGKSELSRISEVNRESVPLSKVPLHVQRALLAAEDRNFYKNGGVSFTGIGRALLNDVKGGPTQGGSTITQQYVKNYFLSQDQTVSRKLKELMISIKIDKQQSKDEILSNYLNTIYFGRGAYGIQTAAQAYFHKDVSQLTVSEGALLASVIRGPSLYDPAGGTQAKQNAEARVKYVLDGMATEGWITPQQRAAATFPKVYPVKLRKASGGGELGYITAEVKRDLKEKLHLSDSDIDRGGLRIVTTIDKKAEDAALKAVDDNMPTMAGTEHFQAGLVAIRPGDGAVVAMYGGKDYSKTQFNSATDAHLQAGSTFKPFGLLAALQQNISTKTRYRGDSPQYFKEFEDHRNVPDANTRGEVKNFNDEQFGNIDLRTATAHSVNTVFAQLNIAVTPAKTMEAAINAGVPKSTKGLSPNMANIFGTASPRVLDMANAYATIAAQGQRATPYLLAKVTSATGGIDYKAEKSLAPAFDKNSTIDATEAMTHVITEGTGTGAQALGRPAAGKTGTTTKNRAVWFDGFVPQLATAVGIYNDVNGTPEPMNNVPGFGQVTGGTFPVKIWTAFMKGALQGMPVMDFPHRVGVGDEKVPTPTPTTTSTPTTSTTTTTTTTTTTAPPSTTTTTTPTDTGTGPVCLPAAPCSPTASPSGGGRRKQPSPTTSP